MAIVETRDVEEDAEVLAMAMVETGEVEAALPIVTGDDIESVLFGSVEHTSVGVGKNDLLERGKGQKQYPQYFLFQEGFWLLNQLH